MSRAKINNKLRIRSDEELSVQMDGLLMLAAVLNEQLDHWYLSGGTLLGAYRDGDFIPWDWDVEVTVLTEEAQPKEGVLIKELLRAGFVISSSDSSYENFKIVASGWGTEYEILGRYLKNGGSVRARLMTEVPAQFFESREVVGFRGHHFPAPSPVDNFLAALYGDWRTPVKTADKSAYFSPAAYTKKSRSYFSLRIRQLWKLLVPPLVREFPKLTRSAIEHFQSWDMELGWCNQSNITKVDNPDLLVKAKKNAAGLAVFSTDAVGSRICYHPNSNSDVSFYGDSYCMCRDVQDQDTFAWHLGKLRNSRVSNFGVANYGLDQALLRLRRDYKNDSAGTVVLAVTSITMARCVSIYGHYLNPGNILAVKPRFRLNDDGSLQVVDYPLESKQDLLKLERHKDFFHQYDEHYRFWRKNCSEYYMSRLPRKVAALLGAGAASQPSKTFDYEVRFWQSHEMLFLGMMNFYHKIAHQYGFKPVFLLQHQKHSLQYVKQKPLNQLPWISVLTKAAHQLPAITFLDEADIFAEYSDIEQFYTGSHHSAHANRMIGDYLNSLI